MMVPVDPSVSKPINYNACRGGIHGKSKGTSYIRALAYTANGPKDEAHADDGALRTSLRRAWGLRMMAAAWYDGCRLLSSLPWR